MTQQHPTTIVGLECTQCGATQTLKVAEGDAELQNRIGYACPERDGPTEKGCGAFTDQIINHIYGEPAASRLRELQYNG